MLRLSKTPRIAERIPREEWDFSLVPEEEQKACCIYEYARESAWIVESKRKSIHHDEQDPRRWQLFNSHLNFAIPPGIGETTTIDVPWAIRSPWWRAWFCRELEANWDGLSYARILPKSEYKAISLGVSQFFSHAHQWPRGKTRDLDQKNGLEVVIMTINWANFDNKEILQQFEHWLKDARPKNIGVRSKQGRKKDEWRKHLEKLAILRLRHHYDFNEIPSLLPKRWTGNKFFDRNEMNRACTAAHKTLLSLYPFLPKQTKPLSWQPFKVN